MAFAREFLQHMAHAGLGTDQTVPGDAQALGQGVGGIETDAVDVQRQAVGVRADLGDGFHAIGLVDARRPRGAQAVRLQKDHDLADDLLLGPGLG